MNINETTWQDERKGWEETAGTKALRQGWAWEVQGTEKEPTQLSRGVGPILSEDRRFNLILNVMRSQSFK